MCNSLEAMLQVKKGKENAVIKKINKNRQSFPKIRKVEKYNDNHVIVSKATALTKTGMFFPGQAA